MILLVGLLGLEYLMSIDTMLYSQLGKICDSDNSMECANNRNSVHNFDIALQYAIKVSAEPLATVIVIYYSIVIQLIFVINRKKPASHELHATLQKVVCVSTVT